MTSWAKINNKCAGKGNANTSCKNSNTDARNFHMLIFIDISNAWSVLKCKQTAMKDESSGHYSTENWNSMLHLRKARKCILEIANHIKYNITKLQTSSFLFAKNPQFPYIPGKKIHKASQLAKQTKIYHVGKKARTNNPFSESWFQPCLKNYLSFGYSSIFVTKSIPTNNSNFMYTPNKIPK